MSRIVSNRCTLSRYDAHRQVMRSVLREASAAAADRCDPVAFSRLILPKAVWAVSENATALEYAAWRQKDWRGHEFVYLWADGIYVNVRSEQRRCLLVLIGCDRRGNKHFLAIEEGYRESTESWKALLLGLRDPRHQGGAETGCGGRCDGLSGGPGRGLSDDSRATLLAA